RALVVAEEAGIERHERERHLERRHRRRPLPAPLLVPARSPLAERHVPELEAGVASGEDLREVRLGGPRRRRQRHRHQPRDRDRPHPWLSVAQRSSVASAAPSSIAHAAFRIPYTKFGATPDATSASAASIRA